MVDGGSGDDDLTSNGGNDSIYGKAGADTITLPANATATGNVFVLGGADDDTIELDTQGLTYLDTIKGEVGSDKILVTTQDTSFDMSVLNSDDSKAFDNISSIETFGIKYELADSSSFKLSSAAQSSGIRTIDNSGATGDGGAVDVLTVDISAFTSSASTNLIGSDSTAIRDSLIGGSGNDTLSTGSGTGTGGDVLFGGAGTDKFVISASGAVTTVSDLNTGETFEVDTTADSAHIDVKTDFVATSATFNNKSLAV